MKLRLLSILCLVYIFLLLYGSLMPFDFVATDDDVEVHLESAWRVWPFVSGLRLSGSDAVSNFLLYVPLGLLLVTRWRLGRGHLDILAVPVAAVTGAVLSIIVEKLQLHSMTRIASVQDVFLNTAGGLAGAIFGAVWGPRGWVALVRWTRWRRQHRPISLVALGLLVVLMVDALLPLLPTLLLSQVWRNLKASHLLDVRGGFAQRPWHYWLVMKVLLYAVLAILLGASSTKVGRKKWVRGAIVALCLATFVEACKPLIVSRSANVANVLTVMSGCVLGMVAGMVMTGRLSSRAALAVATAVAGGFVVYLQLEPFAFAWDISAIRAQVPVGVGWLPLYHRATNARVEVVRVLVRTVMLSGLLAYLIDLLGWWSPGASRAGRAARGAIALGGLGLLLEICQFIIPPRMPLVTDVFFFALGGALGGWIGWKEPDPEPPRGAGLPAGISSDECSMNST